MSPLVEHWFHSWTMPRTYKRRSQPLPEGLDRAVRDVVREHVVSVYMLTGSLRAAARVLQISPSTVSAWVDGDGTRAGGWDGRRRSG